MSANRVVVKDAELLRFLSRFVRPQRGVCTVGVHAKEGDRDEKSNGDGTREPLTNADVARIHEFGAPEANIPQRSFIRATVKKNRERYKRLLATLSKLVVRGRLTHRKALELVGARMTHDMVATIDAGIPPGLKESTIKKKGSSKPLIDTGALKGSITWIYKRR